MANAAEWVLGANAAPMDPATLVGVGEVMIARYDETLLDPAAPVLQAADFAFGNCEWPYSEEMGDTHPVEAHLNDGVEGEDLFAPCDPEAVRLKGRKGFNVLSFANNHSSMQATAHSCGRWR